MQKDEITRLIIRLIASNHASTFFLNGPPGSGKSYFLETLAKDLPSEIQRVLILGPYHIIEDRINGLCSMVIKDIVGAGFITHEPPFDIGCDLVQIWKWFVDNSQIATKQTIIVLIDLGNCSDDDIADIGDLFSNARYLEGIWNSPSVRIHHLIAGYWDHPALENLFDQTNTSFPYTVGHNYFVWTGISPEEMIALVRQRFPTESRIPLGRVLYELTSGHPGAAYDILNRISVDKMSFFALLSATRQAAVDGQMGQVFLQLWSRLPTESKNILREMIFQRRIPAITLTRDLERLYLTGIIHKKQIEKLGYIDFCSWYIELLVHLHAEKLGVSDSTSYKVDLDEFMPRTSAICVEAFLVINEIENLTRNYISVQLCLQTESGFHYLMGRARKYNPEKHIEEDAYQRAKDWQNRSADRGLPVELNPLIAYLSTRDLANLIEELGVESRLPEWLRIAQALRALSDVRDAAMHNQLIGDSELEKLYKLRADIYNALSKQRS